MKSKLIKTRLLRMRKKKIKKEKILKINIKLNMLVFTKKMNLWIINSKIYLINLKKWKINSKLKTTMTLLIVNKKMELKMINLNKKTKIN